MGANFDANNVNKEVHHFPEQNPSIILTIDVSSLV